MKTIKLWIKNNCDRLALMEVLKGNGYTYWIEQHTEFMPMRTYVCFEVEDSEVFDYGC